MALGITALHLRVADLKFTHNFIICDRLWDTEVLIGTDIQKQFSLSYAWDKEKNCYIQKDGRLLTYTRNCEQKATIGIVKSTLKIPPRHESIVPIKITGHTIKGHMAYFISCKGIECIVPCKGTQLRFSPSSGEITTRHWSQFISYLLVF